MRSRTLSLLVMAAFGAGFLALWSWPHSLPEPGAAMSATPSSAVAQRRSGNSPPSSWLARTAAARQRAASLTPPEARAIMENLRPPLRDEDQQWLTEVLRCWAESEPEAALDWLRRWSKGWSHPSRWDAMVLASLARKNLPAAIAAGQSLGTNKYGISFSGVLAAAAERDPAGTMAFVEKNRQLAQAGAKAFRLWLERDAAAACAWLATTKVRDQLPLRDIIADIAALAPERLADMLASLPERSDALENARRVLAALEVDRNPAAALAKFSTLPQDERLRMMEPLSLHLAARGTTAEITGFLGGLTGDERTDFLGKLGDNLSHNEADRLLALVRRPELDAAEKAKLLSTAPHLKPQHAEEFMALLNYQSHGYNYSAKSFWISNLSGAPEETLPILSRMAADGRVDAALLRDITAQLSRHSSNIAERMIAALPAAQQAGPRAMLAVQSALTGSAADLSVFSGLPDAAARRDTLRAVFNERQGDFDAVRRAAFVQQLPPAQQMEALTSMVLTPGDYAVFQPIVEQAARAGTGGDDLEGVVRTLAAQIPDPAAAMQWLETLPAGEAQDAGRTSVFYNVALNDATAASEWLAALPPDTPRRDEMTGALVSRITLTDPERAWQWSATIQNETDRRRVQKAVLTKWRTLDPAAAARAAGE